jgi:hypothetical protein
MSSTALPVLRDHLARRLDADSHSGESGYGVWSVYYDTRDLKFYWEKIEGLKYRRKLRIRHYGDRFAVDDDTSVFVEIKQRVNRVAQIRRSRCRTTRHAGCATAGPWSTTTGPSGPFSTRSWNWSAAWICARSR